jgi:hypothetical protein
MANNTFGVSGPGMSKATAYGQQQAYNNPLGGISEFAVDLKNIVTHTNDVYNPPPAEQSLDLDEISIDGEWTDPAVGERVSANYVVDTGLPEVTDPLETSKASDEFWEKRTAQLNKDIKDKENARQAQAALTILEGANGLVNAYYKHEATVTENNFSIFQANRQIGQIRNQAAFTALRERVKASSRQDSAKLDAVARGQSSSGDVAGIAENNEEMYLAQNLMAIELSAMNSILGLEQQKIFAEASNKISRNNRNASMVNEVVTAGIRLGAM